MTEQTSRPAETQDPVADDAVRCERPGLEPDASGGADSAPDSLRALLGVVRMQTGHDFSRYKPPTLLRCIGRRMQATEMPDLDSYLGLLSTRADEVQALLPELLIGVTTFFRDPVAWAVLQVVIPALFAAKEPDDQVRAWVPGCATGEEAYTIALLLVEHAATLEQPPSIQVFATDIDAEALAVARRGHYPATIAADLTPARLQRFFLRESDGYRVRPELRERVIFAPHNVLRDPPFARLDLVSCRNLLIYLTPEAQARVLGLFHFSLRADGYLLLGSAEAGDSVAELFMVVDRQAQLFQRRDLPHLVPPPLPDVPLRVPAPPPAVSRAAPEGTVTSFAELHHQALIEHAPPSVLVNAAGEIVHLGQGVGRYFQFDEGAPSHILLHLAHPDLQAVLRTALFQARQTGSVATARRVPTRLAEGARLVDVVVVPLAGPAWAAGCSMVLFTDVGAAEEVGTPAVPAGAAADAGDPRVRALEAQLERTAEQLRMMVEQYEVMVEEHRVAAEELQASNEEARAAAEELETSKEELQSANEELQTLNAELRHKVVEVSQAHDDLQNLIVSTQIATLFLDRQLRIKRFTPSTEQIFNLLPTDLNRPLQHITHTLRDHRLVADAQQVLATLHPVSREVQSTTGCWYILRLLPYRTEDDRIEGVVLTFVDITERKQAEAERERLLQEAEQARREAEQALEVRTQFLTIASHELRTPLTPLLGYTGMLQQSLAQAGDARQRKLAETIERQVLRLNTLIGTLLDVSRLQRGQFTLERRPLDLAVLTAQVVDDFRLTLSPDGAGHRITLVAPEAPVPVLADAHRLEEVLHNLLGNAVKYSPKGGAVRVQVARQDGEAVLEVADEGIGIPAEAQAHLFEPFYRAGNVGLTASGFGLGLYIVHEIVERHGGRVEVESAEGRGTVFRVVLPLHGEQ